MFLGVWTIAILYHFREEILEDRARQQFIKKLGLNKRFTVHQLRLAAVCIVVFVSTILNVCVSFDLMRTDVRRSQDRTDKGL